MLLVAATLAIPTLSQAQIRWIATEHDFGAFDEEDGKVSTDFRFINDGDTPVVIDHVRSSCGCTVPEYSKSPVNKGDTASVTVVYNPTGRPGRFSKSLAVKLSDGSTEKLHIKGVVIGAQNTLKSRFPLTYGPLRLRGDMITFGSVKTGKIKSQYIEVYNASRQPVVPRWEGIPKYLRITAAHDTVNPGEQGVYSLVFAPVKSTPYGLLTDSVKLTVGEQPPMTVSIAAIVEEDFSTMTDSQMADAPKISTDSDRLDFGDFTTSSGRITRRLKITNTGKNDLLLRRVYTADNGLTVKLKDQKVKKGKSTVAEVTFDPTGFTAPILNSRLQIIANDPERPMTTIRLVGINNSTE